MATFSSPKPERTVLGGIVAQSEHQVEWLIAEFIDGLRATLVMDTNLCQGAKGKWMDVSFWSSASAEGLPILTQSSIDDSLSHLGAAGVACAQEQYFTFSVSHNILHGGYNMDCRAAFRSMKAGSC